MKQLPKAETYIEGLAYWPYCTSLAHVLDHVVHHAPREGTLVDVMCGPGYLLGEIAKRRTDLRLRGVDVDRRYVTHGRKNEAGVTFDWGNVLQWRPEERFDVVICTGSLHHIRYEQQENAIRNIAAMVKPSGFVVISDCYIDHYEDEMQRRLAAEKLGHEYLVATIRNGAPKHVVGWTLDIQFNDVMMHEFKTSIENRLPLMRECFGSVETTKTWPQTDSLTGYGDYIHICFPK